MTGTQGQCLRCGSHLGRDVGGGVCAACLLEDALPAAEGFGEPAAEHELAADTAAIQHFGPYELLEEIGRGGMGVIYKARQAGLDRVVALKMLLAGEFADARARERLLREARIAARLAHPHIVTIHEVGEHQGRPYFAMEYVPGRNLSQHCRDGLLPVATAVRYVEQLARAVHYAHQHGVIHRDLKPANILISPDDEPKLTDFGLTKSLVDPTQTIESAGSPNFMAPEQADSSLGTTGTPTDIFGLGAILYYLLTGRPPAVGETLSETLRNVMTGEPVAPRQLRPALPRDLETIALKCLEKEPSRRYGSAEEVADELARWQRHEPIHARPATGPERLAKWVRRHPVVAALCAAVALSLLGGLGATSWQWRQAVLARERFERSAYYAGRLASMNTKFEPMVRQELTRVPLHLRGWEWGHLMSRCLPELLFVELSKSPLDGVAASADHRHVACWHQGRVRVFDVRTEVEEGGLGLPAEHSKQAIFSPDGGFLAVTLDDGSVVGRSLSASGAIRKLIQPGMASRSLAFAADSRSLIAADEDGIVRQFAISDGRLIREFDAPPWRFSTASVSTDGALVFGWSDGVGAPAFVRWKLDTGERLPAPAALSEPALQTVLGGRGDVYAQRLDSHRIEVRETASGRLLSSWTEPAKDLVEIALARDGTRLLARSADGRGLLIDATNGGLVAVLPGVTRRLIVAPLSDVVLSLDSEVGYRGWNLETGEETGLFPVPPEPDIPAALSPDGVLAAGTATGRLWTWVSDVGRWGVSGSRSGKVAALAHSPDSTRFASAGADGRLQIWNARTSHQIRIFPGTGSAALTAASWSRDGRWITTADALGFICVRSATTGEIAHRWGAFDGPIESLATDIDSKWIAATGPGVVALWELATGKERWRVGMDSPRGAVTFEPDGPGLYVSGSNGELWETALSTGAKRRGVTLPRVSQGPLVACGPAMKNGRQLAVAVGVWDIEILDAITFRSLGRINPTGIGIQHLAYHPDGSRLAIVLGVEEEDVEPSRLAIWDPWTRQPVLSLNEPGLRLRTASFSPDGLQLIAGGSRGGIRLWDALPWKVAPKPSAGGAREIPESDAEMNRAYWLNRLEALDQRN